MMRRTGLQIPYCPIELADRLICALEAAEEAAAISLKYFRQPGLVVETKDDGSPVTMADREAENAIREKVLVCFPEDGILGEEYGEKQGPSGWGWIIDPIDGTHSFICGVPLFGTLIRITHRGDPQIGVIRAPALGETVYAATGCGAWHIDPDGHANQASVSRCQTLEEATFVYSELACFVGTGHRAFFEGLHRKVRLCRTWGDCFGYLMVATGRADLAVDARLNEWDAAAILPIIREAGGVFCDFSGKERINGGSGIATNRKLLPGVLSILKGSIVST